MAQLPDTAPLRRLAGLVAIGVMTLIAIMSLLPVSDLPAVGGSDKLKHFIAYAALGLALSIWTGRGGAIQALLLAAAYGGLMEVAQMLLPTGREGSVLDEGANVLGAGLGTLVTLILRR